MRGRVWRSTAGAPTPIRTLTASMIQRQKRRLVLFLPHRADPAQGVRVSADLTPLELLDRKSTRLNSSHLKLSRMPSSA